MHIYYKQIRDLLQHLLKTCVKSWNVALTIGFYKISANPNGLFVKLSQFRERMEKLLNDVSNAVREGVTEFPYI